MLAIIRLTQQPDNPDAIIVVYVDADFLRGLRIG